MLRAILLSVLFSVSNSLALAEWRPLLEADTAPAAIADAEPVILDIRSPGAYAAGHLEDAVNVPYAAWRGPETNPGALISAEKLSLLLSEAGIEPDVPVLVTYQGKGTLDFGSAARVYWTLKSAGVAEIAILNGGIEAWSQAGHPLTTEEASNFPSDLEFDFAPDWRIDRDGVKAIVAGTRAAQLIDARPAAFFKGRQSHDAAAWAGTLTGAVNLVHDTWFEGSRLAADKTRIAAALEAAGYDPSGPDIVSFCNTGHWAATNWFVLSELAGIENVKLYPESMVGWTRAQARLAAK